MPKLIARSLVLIAMVALPNMAHAQSGVRVTAIGGLERTDSGPGAGAEDGFYYGAQVGKDWAVGGVLLGLEGEVGGSTAEGTYLLDPARQGLFANAAVRLAIPVTGSTRVFARGGVAHHRIDYATRTDFSGTGYTLGGGIEQDLGSQVFVRGEYRYSDYGSQVRGQHFVGGIGLKF